MVEASKPTQWWWIRHAPVAGSQGSIHLADAPIGAADPAALARLKPLLPMQALWLTSTMRRSIETAKHLTLVRPLPVAAFDEQDFGDWTGSSHKDLWESGDRAYRAFWDDPAGSVPPCGESYAAQQLRVAAAIDRLSAEHAGATVVAVAHAGTIRAALAHALDLAPARALSLVIDPWSLTRIDHVAGAWRVVQVNLR